MVWNGVSDWVEGGGEGRGLMNQRYVGSVDGFNLKERTRWCCLACLKVSVDAYGRRRFSRLFFNIQGFWRGVVKWVGMKVSLIRFKDSSRCNRES